MSPAPRVEVVVVTWNGRDDTVRAIDSIVSTAPRVDYTITVVDNGSTDGTVEIISSRFPQVRILRHYRNTGFTGGIAQGVSASEAEYVVFLNNDAVVEKGWLDELTTAIDGAGPDVIAVGGKIVDESARLIDFIGGLLTFDGHALQKGFRKEISEVDEPADGAELLFACGGNMVVRREAFLNLGGFDRDYFAYLEDVDFGWRSWLSGWRISYASRAVVRHKSAATSQRLGNFERGVLFERNALQTAMKNYDDVHLQQFAGPIFLTLLHRLHHYLSTRNDDISSLTAAPFEGNGSRGRRGKAIVEDELTQMQFRALHWFFGNQERILEKRKLVQSKRRRTDEEIFRKFPVHYIATYPGDSSLIESSLFRLLMPRVPSREMPLQDVIRL